MGLVAVIAIVIVGVVVIGGIVGGMAWGVNHPLSPGKETKAIKGADGKPAKVIGGRKEPKMLTGEGNLSYLDAEATGDEIRAVLEPFRKDEVIGYHVGRAYAALNRAEFSRDGIVSLMEREFGRESLTWERFSAPVEAALGSVHSNSARIANIAQAFDSGEYLRLGRLRQAGQVADGSQQANRLDAMGAQLREMGTLADDSETMLEELGRLQTELAKLTDSHQAVTSEEIAEEVRNLADMTREYMPSESSNILNDFDAVSVTEGEGTEGSPSDVEDGESE